MSRIGAKPIAVPRGVSVKIDGGKVSVSGPLGELSLSLAAGLSAAVENDRIVLHRKGDGRQDKAQHGLYRALVNNMVAGVSQGYQKTLLIMYTRGTTYRAELKGNTLLLDLGYTQPVRLPVPAGVKVELPAPDRVVVKGADKHAVGQFAALVRAARRPDVHRDRGVRYEGEYVRRIKIAKPGVT